METGIKPSTIMLMSGGAVLFISTILDWRDNSFASISGWDIDAFGVMGIFVAVIGLVIAVGVGATTFANVKFPEEVLGFTPNQIYVSLAEAAFLITFGQQFAEDWGVGILLGWIAAGVAVAGGIMETQSEVSGAAPPTQF